MTETPEPKRLRYRSLLRDALFLVLALVAVQLFQTRNVASGHAPPFSEPDLTGLTVVIPTAHQRRVVHFFATWCGVCKAEEHNIVALAQDHDVVLVATASGTRDEVQRYARSHGLTMPIVVDDGALARAYGVAAYPTTFFVDGEGEIDFAVVGYTTEIGMRVRRFLTR